MNEMKVYETTVEELQSQVAELESALLFLEGKISNSKKQIVLQRDVMIKHLLEKPMTHKEISEKMEITTKNVASLKHQIVNLLDGDKNRVWEILVDSAKRMHLMKVGEFKI